MKAPIFSKALMDMRWQVAWYGVGLAFLCALVVYIYPSYQEQLSTLEIPEALRPLMGDAAYNTPEGFLTAEFFSFGPVLALVFGIMAGTSLIAGDEIGGTLELLLSQPISRRRLLLEKVAAFVVAAVCISALINVGWLLSIPFVDIDIGLWTVLAATFLMVPPLLFVGMLALWLSVSLAGRKMATGIVSAFVIGSFFLNYLSQLVDVLLPLKWLSFNAYMNSNVLADGFEPLKAVALLGGAVLFAYLAMRAFDRREIGVQVERSGFAWLHRAGDTGAKDEARSASGMASPQRGV